MKLIDTDELLQAARVKGIAGESAAKFLMLLLRFRRINKIYDENSSKSGMDFIDSMNEELGIRYEIGKDELDKIGIHYRIFSRSKDEKSIVEKSEQKAK